MDSRFRGNDEGLECPCLGYDTTTQRARGSRQIYLSLLPSLLRLPLRPILTLNCAIRRNFSLGDVNTNVGVESETSWEFSRLGFFHCEKPW